MPAARCPRSYALLGLALVALASLPAPASSGAAEWGRAALRVADGTVAIPLDAPLPAGATGLGPGTYLLSEIDGSTYACTANWAWTDGSAYYLGAAGHCFLAQDKTATHGPGRDANASGVRVRACVYACEFSGTLDFLLTGDTVELGPVVYARQARGGVEIGEDFGLVRIPDALVHEIRSALPVWGRPPAPSSLRAGDLACVYGNGVGVGETYLTKARMGVGIVTLDGVSWRAAIPSAPGDSGSAVAECGVWLGGTRATGAVGVLTHLSSGGTAGTTLAQSARLAKEAGLTVQPVL